ncbi:HAD family hydrolase [Streptomyces griseocarneus]|uniref:HAD family hydrolase n=1 Tax=Streptomyces griseocarneus TaxID=51201 RepID=UPI00167D9A1A|nr:HAD family hydrolase [Streptomyces griseocarneus]MBZ6476707.1 HAD family hydrolase [Streptomyces griseocarneus]GHG80457.1 dUMP phosphatase [Streptomyces griseocarneus]
MRELVALFDLDDTLIPRQKIFAKWAAEFSAEHGVPLEWLLKADPEYSSRRAEFFELAKTTFGVRPPVEELHAQYRRRMPELVEPDPQVCAMLVGLREAGWRLGVVTNGMVGTQTNKLHQAGLYDLVDTVVISEAVGVWKPDARIFRHALTQLDAVAGPRVVMVGDSLEHDVAGARITGLTTVWVSDGRSLPRTGPRPQHTIRTVTEAAELLHAVVN